MGINYSHLQMFKTHPAVSFWSLGNKHTVQAQCAIFKCPQFFISNSWVFFNMAKALFITQEDIQYIVKPWSCKHKRVTLHTWILPLNSLAQIMCCSNPALDRGGKGVRQKEPGFKTPLFLLILGYSRGCQTVYYGHASPHSPVSLHQLYAFLRAIKTRWSVP